MRSILSMKTTAYCENAASNIMHILGAMDFPHPFEAKALQYETVHVLSLLAFKVFSGFLLLTPISINL